MFFRRTTNSHLDYILKAASRNSNLNFWTLNIGVWFLKDVPIQCMFEVRTQVGDGMWTFEQEQKLANIAVNARETQLEIHDKTKIQVTAVHLLHYSDKCI